MDWVADKIGKNLEGCNIFITGGTGFFGKSLLKFFKELFGNGYKFNVFILSRNPENFLRDNSEFIDDNFQFIAGDIRNFSMPSNMKFKYFIHGATAASLSMIKESPTEMFEIITQGTKRVIEECEKNNVEKLLFISSGAVYGEQPFDVEKISETMNCEPKTIYGKGKLEAENLCLKSNVSSVIARCFTFVGEYLPLDLHFAVGNFIKNGLNSESIVIKSDGSAIRSYMHSEDLVRWLIIILLFGDSGDIFNVGSDEEISIKDLAYLVAECFEHKIEVEVQMVKSLNLQADRYIPDITFARDKLNLELNFDNKKAINKTVEYLKKRRNNN